MRKFTPVAARVSEDLNKLGLSKYSFDADQPGYRTAQWVQDEHDNPTVKVEWFMGKKPDVGLGARTENRVRAAHRERLQGIMGTLQEIGYAVTWGWDPDTGDPDSSFLAVISWDSVDADKTFGEDAPPKQEPQEVDEEAVTGHLQSMAISLKEAHEVALAVNRAYNIGRDEQARRLEHQLMRAVLTAIVYGTEEPVDLAAAALSVQHLPFAR